MIKHRLSTSFMLLVYVLIAISCSGNSKKSEEVTIEQEPELIEVSIGGMSCLGCEQTIQMNVSKLEGINSVKASFTTGNAIIEYLPGKVDTIEIKDAITGSGYTVNKFLPVQQ